MAITNPDFANLTGRMVDPFQPPPPPNVPLPNERHVVDPYEHSRYADIMKHFKDYWGREGEEYQPIDVDNLISQGVDPSIVARMVEEQNLNVSAMEQFKVSPYDRWLHGQGTLPPIEAGTVNILPGLHGYPPPHSQHSIFAEVL